MTAPLEVPSSVRRQRLSHVFGALSYVRRSAANCFICAVVSRDPDYPHHIVYETDSTIAFLAKNPMHWGHTLICPKQHREYVVSDFSLEQYTALQADLHRVATAVERAVPCERLYVLSVGSQQMNRHVHWHVTPLPPGVPLPLQQFRSFSQYIAGVLHAPESAWELLAARIRAELEGDARS